MSSKHLKNAQNHQQLGKHKLKKYTLARKTKTKKTYFGKGV